MLGDINTRVRAGHKDKSKGLNHNFFRPAASFGGNIFRSAGLDWFLQVAAAKARAKKSWQTSALRPNRFLAAGAPVLTPHCKNRIAGLRVFWAKPRPLRKGSVRAAARWDSQETIWVKLVAPNLADAAWCEHRGRRRQLLALALCLAQPEIDTYSPFVCYIAHMGASLDCQLAPMTDYTTYRVHALVKAWHHIPFWQAIFAGPQAQLSLACCSVWHGERAFGLAICPFAPATPTDMAVASNATATVFSMVASSLV
jgi:hypothetical protein